MQKRRFRIDSFEALRRRMIAETELALVYGLRFPERIPRIPTMEVGVGSFEPDFAARYWSEALGIDLDDKTLVDRWSWLSRLGR